MENMKRVLVWVMMACCVAGVSQAKNNGKLYGVAFYNLENLFDTVHNEGKNDYEYLPDGRNKWNTEKYMSKLRNLAQVLSELATDKLPEGAAVIGMSEVEDRGVWRICSDSRHCRIVDMKWCIMRDLIAGA